MNNLNHGLVELCCLEQHYDLLEYLTNLNRPELPVWNILLKFYTSDIEEEALCAGQSLSVLTSPIEGSVNPNWKRVSDNGGITTLIKVNKTSAVYDLLAYK